MVCYPGELYVLWFRLSGYCRAEVRSEHGQCTECLKPSDILRKHYQKPAERLNADRVSWLLRIQLHLTYRGRCLQRTVLINPPPPPPNLCVRASEPRRRGMSDATSDSRKQFLEVWMFGSRVDWSTGPKNKQLNSIFHTSTNLLICKLLR